MNPFSQLIFFILITFTIRTTRSANFINSTCTKLARDDPNIDYTFCATSLQAAPASKCAVMRGLGSISIRLLRDNVTDTHCQIKHLLIEGEWDSYVKQCLNVCLELFSDAISAIKEAHKSYNDKIYEEANVRISAVMDAPVTCEDGFMEKEGVVSPLSKRNNDTFQLSAIVLSLMHLLEIKSN